MMVKRRMYKVFYHDGEKIVGKDLAYIERDGNLLFFFNPTRNITEILNERKIHRIEEGALNGCPKNKNNSQQE